MRLPNAQKAQIPEAKIAKYLLSTSHRAGKSKAAFFESFGFSVENWQDLAMALQEHALTNPVVATEETPFGMRYVIDGLLVAPNGGHLNIRSAWFIDRGEEEPRFITAHPLKRSGL